MTVEQPGPVRGVWPIPVPHGQTGLETMQADAVGARPLPPISRLTGLRLTEASAGRTTFTMPLSPWFQNGVGFVDPGMLAFLADAGLSTSVHSTLPPGKGVVTSELSVKYIQPIHRDASQLICRAETLHSNQRVGASTCELLDSDGRLLGHGSTRCVVIDIPTVDVAQMTEHPPKEVSPDPWEGLMPLTIQEPATFDDMTGLEVCLGYLHGQFEITPIDLLFGGRGIEFEDGRAVWEFPTSPWLASGAGTVFGGAIARFSQAALETAMLTTYPRQTIYATLDLQVHFLRPTLPETGTLRIEATVDQRGRTVTFASARVTNEEDKLVALARASALVVPDGMRRILRGDFAEEMLDAAIAGG